MLAVLGVAAALAAVWSFVRFAETFAQQNAGWQAIESVHAGLPLPEDATEQSRAAVQPGPGSFLCLTGPQECPYDVRTYRAASLDAVELRTMLKSVPGMFLLGCRTTKREVWCIATMKSAGRRIDVTLTSGRRYPGSDREYLLVEVNADTIDY